MFSKYSYYAALVYTIALCALVLFVSKYFVVIMFGVQALTMKMNGIKED